MLSGDTQAIDVPARHRPLPGTCMGEPITAADLKMLTHLTAERERIVREFRARGMRVSWENRQAE